MSNGTVSFEYEALFLRQNVYLHIPNVPMSTKIGNGEYRITRAPGDEFYLMTHRETGVVFELARDLVVVSQRKVEKTDAPAAAAAVKK